MALGISLISVALVAILGQHLVIGQLIPAYATLTAAGTCISPGLFPNPGDCNGYLQCAADQPRPYVRKCSPGTLFHAERRECVEPERVVCFPRPRTDQVIGTRIIPTVYQALPAQVVTGPNVVVLRLYDPVLRADQCTSLGQQMTSYLRQLVNSMQPACAANTICQTNLPVFRVDCLTNNGRLVF
ncbi:hypothetical protein PoB_004841500 [Plakobranchus ocellatus]|uniref:Chitin-binding type-2 domain-containing protein n=1 Tax=Plakobranchus ocellatus TaxID=259542 RepID=A0AAV4BMY9_9GAST|nr:hypothetical protein PoB_004841500 [Plakobranchus ocellatus]